MKRPLPYKECVVCKKPFSWRKKWEKVWEDVKYCSKRCRSNKNEIIKLSFALPDHEMLKYHFL